MSTSILLGLAAVLQLCFGKPDILFTFLWFAPTKASFLDDPILLRPPPLVDGGELDPKYTCDGANVSPPLNWSALPSDTRSIAVICDDIDAPLGDVTHWLLYDVPPGTRALPEGSIDAGKEGMNSLNQPGYTGPCPPPGAAHRYVFHVYAVDVSSIGEPGLFAQQVKHVIEMHFVAEAH